MKRRTAQALRELAKKENEAIFPPEVNLDKGVVFYG